MRSPRFRRSPFIRNGVSDHGRAVAPRLTVRNMLPSTFVTASASAGLSLSRLNIPLHMIAVYASWPSSPAPTQHSLQGGSLLPYPDRTFTGWTAPASPGALQTDTQRFWEDAGRQAFNAASTLLAETPGSGFLSIENITRLFTRSDGHEWMAARINEARTRGDPYSSNVVDGISDYIGDDPKLRNDIRKTVSTRLALWTYPQIAAVTARSDFDLRDLRRKPMTIYVVVSPV